jgi:hypothetical protein
VKLASSKLQNMDTPTVVQVTEPAEREGARLRSVRPYPSSCIEREGNGRRAIHGLLTTLDPNPDAIPCNSEQSREQRTAYLCEICKPVQHSATPDRTLVMSRKAVRVRSSALCTLCTGTKTSRQKGLDIPPSPKEANVSTTTSHRCSTANTRPDWSFAL